jgi:hypothetical protein
MRDGTAWISEQKIQPAENGTDPRYVFQKADGGRFTVDCSAAAASTDDSVAGIMGGKW